MDLSQIPTSILIGVGVLVLSNLGLIVTVGTFVFKAGMFVNETRAGIAAAAESAKMAHKRLNSFEGNRR